MADNGFRTIIGNEAAHKVQRYDRTQTQTQKAAEALEARKAALAKEKEKDAKIEQRRSEISGVAPTVNALGQAIGQRINVKA